MKTTIALPLAAAALTAGAKAPHILIAIADDAGHMSAYGTPWVSTPAFDSVARQGLLFNNAFTCNSKSAPSRACMITGLNSWQLGEAANHNCNFPADVKSFPEALAAAGYYTGVTGKGWGPGIAVDADGNNRHLTGKEWNKIKCDPPTDKMAKIDYAANFEAFLDKWDGESPICFWYGAREPHRGYEYGSSARFGKDVAMIDSVPGYWPDNEVVRTDMLDYAVEVEYYDRHLGRILELMEQRGLLDNTIVIATSDHGMPFPRVKGQEYYNSCHVPMAVMWRGGVVNPGRSVDERVTLTDIAPTLFELAGVDPVAAGMKPMAGQSMADILADNVNSSLDRDGVLIGKERHDVGRPDDQGYPIRGLVKGDYLYVHNYATDRWPAGNPETGYMNIDGSPTKTEIIKARHNPETKVYWDLSMGKRGEHELYNIKNDPDCMVNLADDPAYAALMEEMEAEMTTRLREQGDPRMDGKGYLFDQYPNVTKSRFYWNRTIQGNEVLPHGWIDDTDFDPEMAD